MDVADAETGELMPTEDAVREARGAVIEQIEYELRGAWRAGYNYLHVYGPTLGSFDPDDPVTTKQAVLPTDDDHPRRYTGDYVYQHTYDLTSVSDDAIREAVRNSPDD